MKYEISHIQNYINNEIDEDYYIIRVIAECGPGESMSGFEVIDTFKLHKEGIPTLIESLLALNIK